VRWWPWRLPDSGPRPIGFTQRTALRLELILLVIGCVVFAGLAARNGWFSDLDFFLYDRAVISLAGEVPADVVIVGIDEQSLVQRGRWPWARSDQAELLRAIARAKPASVMIDILHSEPTTAAQDAQLIAALNQLPNLTLPMFMDAVTQSGQLIELLPLPDVLETADQMGHVHPELDEDGISRGIYLYQGIGTPRWPHIALSHTQRQRTASCEVAVFSLLNARCEYRMIPFVGTPGTFAHISALDLLTGDNARINQTLQGKTVLVGVTATAVADWVTTPVSGRSRPMAGVEFNANVLAAIEQNTLIETADIKTTLWVTLLLALLPPLVLPRLRSGAMLLSAIGFILLPIGIFYGLLGFFQYYLPLSSAAVAGALVYPIWSWRRLAIAWRYFAEQFEHISVERLQLGAPELDDDSFREVIAHVELLLGANAKVVPMANSTGPEDGSDSFISPTADECELRGSVPSGGRMYELSLHRDTPFDESERKFVLRVLRSTALLGSSPPMTLERLNARIGRLTKLSDDVRTAREVTLRSLEQITSGVCLVSAGGIIEYANSSFIELTGLAVGSHATMIANRVSAPPGTQWHDVFYTVAVATDSSTFETQAGEKKVVIDCAPLRSSNEPKGYWLMTVVDVSDIRLAQRQREEALAFLSHDLRSPMVSILALLKSNKSENTGPVLLEQIEGYVQRSLNVSEQFVQLSRVENQERIDTYDVELGDIASNSVEAVYAQARAKKVVITNAEGPEDGVWLLANGELLERAIINLLTNAIKYSEEGKPVHVSHRIIPGEGAICVVKDHGYGIPADELDRIFEPYYRSNVRQVSTQRGVGLGLRFVRTLMKRYGGRVEVASELDVGTEFTLHFPASMLIESRNEDDPDETRVR